MARKFKFISPGIFLRELDESVLPDEPGAVGPVIIGRTRKGPSFIPTKVRSYSEFVEVFGTPVAGIETNGDVWRSAEAGTAPTYASFAAQAWLTNNSPCTVIRLAGAQNPSATDAGKAGWKTAGSASTTLADNGGAYGLFIWNSGSANANDTVSTGTLAAVWYLESGAITLSGTTSTISASAAGVATSSAGDLIVSTGNQTTGGQWKVDIRNAAGTVTETKSFGFNKQNGSFIRSVFNTNPVTTNTTLTTTTKSYWLGETFESNILRSTTLSQSNGTLIGAVLALKDGTGDGSVFQNEVTQAESGWVISQDTSDDTAAYEPGNMQKLFKIKSRPSGGEWDQASIKISIKNIKYNLDTELEPYGSFTVEVRRVSDNDQEVEVLESFGNLDLNPNSLNYVGRMIGDKDIVWDYDKRRFTEVGNYPNRSRYITVEMHPDVDDGDADPMLLPFGFFGPPRFKSATLTANSNAAGDDPAGLTFITAGSASIPLAPANIGAPGAFLSQTGSLSQLKLPTVFPSLVDWVRVSASAGFGTNAAGETLASPNDIRNSYFGLQTNGGTDAEPGATLGYDNGYVDLVRQKPTGIDSFTAGGNTEASFVFSLDNVRAQLSPAWDGTYDKLTDAVWIDGSRAAGTSMSAVSASADNWKTVLDMGINKFTMPLFGGTDGVDVAEMDPFNNASIGASETVSYEYNSIRRAIDSVADPESLEMNLLTAPGVDTNSLTKHMIDVCEGRGDALAVIDLVGGYTPRAESKDSRSDRIGNVRTVIDEMRSRKLNSSYGCAYYPWVQILDSNSEAVLWIPPSIAALGTFASSETESALWFAPAGFNRGGLTQGSSGLTVINTDGHLTARDRDNLYEVNVNPIAKFPAEGIVIFGQKTLQIKASALDRINVRRLLIFLKREISKIASGILFEQNVSATWTKFSDSANQLLEGVKIGGGLTDYKVVLDETTTTPDLVDRNTLYAKVFLKPARAIEFIALDFIITRSGASFDD